MNDDWKLGKRICRGCWETATHVCFNQSLDGDYYCPRHTSDCCEEFENRGVGE